MTRQVSDEAALLRIASATVALAGENDSRETHLPEEIRLVPWDWVRSTNGDFLLDQEAAEAVLREFARHGTDLVIDYEHQSLGGRYASPSGLAPAAGWITSLEIRPGEGIWGRVRWTPAAARRVLRREYRFLSPVVIIRKEDRKVMALDSVALTNRPAIAGMQPVVNRRTDGTGPDDGHATEATEGEPADTCRPEDRVEAKEVPMQDELKQLRQLLSLDEQTGEAEVVRQACSRLADLLEQSRQQEATRRVACAMEAGKVCEAQKPWATRYALRDAAGFEEWVKEAPVLVPLQRATSPSEPPQHGQRRILIAAARGEYQANGLLRQLTGERAYVDEALQQAGLSLLADQESL